MATKSRKTDYAVESIEGRFDSRTAAELTDKLKTKLKKEAVAGAVLDFSAVTHITADGMLGLKHMAEQVRSDGKELVIQGMRSEMYKALKVAGVSEALAFSHRTTTPPAP